MEVILAGIQGSGKGTHGKRLIDDFGYSQIGMGDACRAIAKTDTELGREVKSYMDRGVLVPNHIVSQVLEDAVRGKQPDQRLLFDGYPRNVEQARVLDTIMDETKRVATCIHLLLDDETARARLRVRAEIEQRPDDADPAVVEKRIATFKEETLPVVEHYRTQDKLIEVDGRPSIEEVWEKVRGIILKFKK